MLTYTTTSDRASEKTPEVGVRIETCISALTKGHCWEHGA